MKDERQNGGAAAPHTVEDWDALAMSLQLSARQMEVAHGLYEDQKEERIAMELGISRHTVHSHKKILYARLKVSSQIALVKLLICEHVQLSARRAAQEHTPAADGVKLKKPKSKRVPRSG